MPFSSSPLVHASAGGTNGATTGAINTTGSDLIVITVANFEHAPIGYVVNDSQGNTYTALTVQTTATPTQNQLYFCLNPTTNATHTFTVSHVSGGIYSSIYVTAWSGAKTSSSFDQENGNTETNTSTTNPGTVTPSENDELVISGLMFEDNSAGAVSIGGGFTVSDTLAHSPGNYYGGAIAYLVQTTAASANPVWNITNNAAAVATTIATFKAQTHSVVDDLRAQQVM